MYRRLSMRKKFQSRRSFRDETRSKMHRLVPRGDRCLRLPATITLWATNCDVCRSAIKWIAWNSSRLPCFCTTTDNNVIAIWAVVIGLESLCSYLDRQHKLLTIGAGMLLMKSVKILTYRGVQKSKPHEVNYQQSVLKAVTFIWVSNNRYRIIYSMCDVKFHRRQVYMKTN